MRGKLFLKRVLDFAVSFVWLVLLSAPFAIIALAIKLDSKGSVFFRFSSYSAELGAM
ncbi:sugar transferase [Candidatus Bipolaricaulota bacterium]|nr:sugar transferase [Candidatus Bipolaricaulota bacterium]